MITLNDANEDFNRLKLLSDNFVKDPFNISPRCRIGNNIVDFFTFTERLNTKGKYDINFFEFIANIDELKKNGYLLKAENTFLLFQKV